MFALILVVYIVGNWFLYWYPQHSKEPTICSCFFKVILGLIVMHRSLNYCCLIVIFSCFIFWFSFIALCVIAVVHIWRGLSTFMGLPSKELYFIRISCCSFTLYFMWCIPHFSYGIPVIILDHYKYVCVCDSTLRSRHNCHSLYWFLTNSKETDCNKVVIKKYSRVYLNKC